MTRIIKLITLFLISVLMVACSPKGDKGNDSTEPPSSIVISGIVRTVELGKDSYVANIQTNDGDTYVATINAANLVRPENFIQFKVGDRAMVSGLFSIINKERRLDVKEVVRSLDTPGEFIIYEDSFHGITIGEEITTYSQHVKKEIVEADGASFDIYRIKGADGEIIGFFYPDVDNANLVGDITVETPLAATKNKIKIGTTIGYLRENMPLVQVRGSEVDGKTYATFKNFAYLLDIKRYETVVTMNRVPKDAKVTQIVIKK